MDDDLRVRADARLEDALVRSTLRDPREFYRAGLRRLRERDPAAFERCREHYERVLLPRVAEGTSDPIAEWIAYGLRLAEASGAGRVVAVAPRGRAFPFDESRTEDHLILHLPEDPRTPPLVIGMPRELTPPQRATYELLVLGNGT